MVKSNYYTLKELCLITNTTRSKIQGYESFGLIKNASRNKMNHLLYDDSSIEIINKIVFYQKIGFSLKEIVELKNLSDDELLKLLELKLSQLDTNITILEELKIILQHYILSIAKKPKS